MSCIVRVDSFDHGEDETIHDIIIIGAGPCGLAVAARLCEDTPSAVFTDEEHQRYHWIKRHSPRMSIKDKRNGRVRAPTAVNNTAIGGIQDLDPESALTSDQRIRKCSTLVLDSTADQWLGRWETLFQAFEISHLRSPMFFHVDPCDRDGLLAYTYEQGREKELEEIRDCVGKEVSKHHRKLNLKRRNHHIPLTPMIDERDRKDYFTPSTSLFANHCSCVIQRYSLGKEMIRKETVQDIDYDYMEQLPSCAKLFRVKTDQGVHFAKIVVLAVGSGNPPCLHAELRAPTLDSECHAMQIREFPAVNVSAKIKAKRTTNVVVVGGGLTSAQIADMAIRKGVTRVWHIMRSGIKVKPFDIDLPWMGKFRNLEQAVFWSADTDEERLEKIKTARNGGSITPKFHKIMKRHISTGRLSLCLNSTISSKSYNQETKTWRIQVTSSSLVSNTGSHMPFKSTNKDNNSTNTTTLPPIDYIYYATGIQSDFQTLPYLDTLNAKHPIPAIGGLPCLNDDLMWSDDVPLFVSGRLASLRLGPGGPNLAGARIGAERIAWSVQEMLGKHGDAGEGEKSGGVDADVFNYSTARGNRFDSLVECGE